MVCYAAVCVLTMVVVTGSSSVSKVALWDEWLTVGDEEADAVGAEVMLDNAADWPILPSSPPDDAVDIKATGDFRGEMQLPREQTQLRGYCSEYHAGRSTTQRRTRVTIASTDDEEISWVRWSL